MNEVPIPSSADVDELDAAIAAGRLPVRPVDSPEQKLELFCARERITIIF
jgi:hypothetical protein